MHKDKNKIYTYNYKGEGNTLCVVGPLISGNQYTLKVRAYKTENGKTTYGKYSKIKKVTVKIKAPKKPTITKRGVNFVNIKWNKIADVDGYELRMYNTKTKTHYTREYAGANKTSVRRDNMNYPNTKYQFKVRAFKKVNGKKKYSSYSKAVTVRTKKATTSSSSNSSSNKSTSNSSSSSSSIKNSSTSSKKKQHLNLKLRKIVRVVILL